MAQRRNKPLTKKKKYNQKTDKVPPEARPLYNGKIPDSVGFPGFFKTA